MSRHFFCLVTAVTTAPFVPGHDGFVFDNVLLPFYDELIEEIKRRRLTASRYTPRVLETWTSPETFYIGVSGVVLRGRDMRPRFLMLRDGVV
jgi:hypothetical protein